MVISDRTKNIEPSATLAINAKANMLKQAGHNIISLCAGEPDFCTPDAIAAAGIKAINDGHSHYTAVSGMLELRQAISKKLKRDNNLDYQDNEIIVSNGAKQSIFNAIAATINPGDEVIITAPYWVSYPDMVKLNGGIPVICKPKNGIKPTAEDISLKISAKTKMLIINSPNNPAGYKLGTDHLKSIGALISQHPKIIILSDDIYEYLSWTTEPFSNIVNTNAELKDRTILINGVSKGYAMTGWRIGYSASSNPEIIKAMNKYQSQTTSCPSVISQYASIKALETTRKELEPMFNKYKSRHEIMYNGLKNVSGISVIRCEGAFYSFPDCSDLIQKLNLTDDIELAKYLLEQHQLAVVPGSAFGVKNHIRLSFACAEATIEKALNILNDI